LSLSLAEAMGAKFTIDSEPGRGVRAHLTFPAPTRVAG
jgi:signal transduction histidine kinase